METHLSISLSPNTYIATSMKQIERKKERENEKERLRKPPIQYIVSSILYILHNNTILNYYYYIITICYHVTNSTYYNIILFVTYYCYGIIHQRW